MQQGCIIQIQETSRYQGRVGFPEPTASRIRVQIPIVIITYDIWYREKKKEGKRRSGTLWLRNDLVVLDHADLGGLKKKKKVC